MLDRWNPEAYAFRNKLAKARHIVAAPPFRHTGSLTRRERHAYEAFRRHSVGWNFARRLSWRVIRAERSGAPGRGALDRGRRDGRCYRDGHSGQVDHLGDG